MSGEDEKARLTALVSTLEESIESLYKCSVIVDNFEDDSQLDSLNSMMKDFTDSLQNMNEIAKHVETKVPLRVIHRVDADINPHQVTKEYLDICKKKNDEARGRLFATRVFEESLQQRLQVWNDNK